jgi:hypothetical protein
MMDRAAKYPGEWISEEEILREPLLEKLQQLVDGPETYREFPLPRKARRVVDAWFNQWGIN